MKICLKEKKARSKGQRVNRSTCEKYCTKVVKKQQKKRRVNNKRENVFLYDWLEGILSADNINHRKHQHKEMSLFSNLIETSTEKASL